MLRYINAGSRRYAQRPVPCYPRRAVEFQLVKKGSARPIRKDTIYPTVESPVLWIHGPDSPHGWTDQSGQESEVMVIQFYEVNPVLLHALGPEEFLYCKLSPVEVGEFETMYKRLKKLTGQQNRLGPLYLDEVKTQLCLLALRNVPTEKLKRASRRHGKVDQAVSWYREKFTECPTVTEMAAAVHLSPVHLRRLFQKELGRSPHEVMNDIRMNQAKKWLQEEKMPVNAVSESLGFSEPSAFTRAFRHWRKRHG